MCADKKRETPEFPDMDENQDFVQCSSEFGVDDFDEIEDQYSNQVHELYDVDEIEVIDQCNNEEEVIDLVDIDENEDIENEGEVNELQDMDEIEDIDQCNNEGEVIELEDIDENEEIGQLRNEVEDIDIQNIVITWKRLW